jgi:hypothetical protein
MHTVMKKDTKFQKEHYTVPEYWLEGKDVLACSHNIRGKEDKSMQLH